MDNSTVTDIADMQHLLDSVVSDWVKALALRVVDSACAASPRR